MPLGRLLIVAGLILVAMGLLVTFGGRLPIRLGQLPGDIVVRGKSGTFYFPIVTCLLLSVVVAAAFLLVGDISSPAKARLITLPAQPAPNVVMTGSSCRSAPGPKACRAEGAKTALVTGR